MPTGGSSFLSSLTKRKKSPEQLVKLAVACLQELPPVNDDNWTTEPGVPNKPATAAPQPPPSLENLTIDENKSLHATGTVADELAASAQSLTSSEGNKDNNNNNADVAAARPTSGSDAAPPVARRPSFFLSAFAKKESSSSADQPSIGSSSGGGEVSSGDSKSRPVLGRPPSLSVSKFFLDSSKKQPSSGATSPHGTSLSHSNSLGHTEDGTTMERLAKRLSQMKLILYGDGEKEVEKDKCVELAEQIIKEGLMPLLLDHYTHLPFEARKDAASIFNNIARHNHGGFADPYIADQHFSIIEQLINGYGHPDVALNCGSMLREASRHEKVARRILFSPFIWPFFDTYVHLPNFDVASDSFATLRDLLTKHKNVAAEFLEKEYDQVFTKYKTLLSSDNYVTRRMSLKMLGEVLLDRANFNVMMKYISSKENLKAIMNLLRDKSASIQFEAFHVFKVFVANPKKPPEIVKILVTNREKLVNYLTHFHTDKDDDQFREEKFLLVNTLSKLEYDETAK